MLKKIILSLFLVFSTIRSTFAVEPNFLAKPFVEFFGSEGLGYILKNDVAVAGLLYVAYLLGFFNILKVAMKPVFGSEHQKEKNTVAMMLSFIGVTGLYYVYRGSASEMIVLFGGSVGFMFLCIIGLSFVQLIYHISKGEDEKLSKWGRVRVALASAFVTFILSVFVEKAMGDYLTQAGVWSWIYSLLTASVGYLTIALIVLIFMAMGKKRVDSVEEFVESNPEVVSAHHHIKRVQEGMKSINSKMKEISKELKV